MIGGANLLAVLSLQLYGIKWSKLCRRRHSTSFDGRRRGPATPQSDEGAASSTIVERGLPHEIPKGERRHLTVLFCDLVGSTEMASHLDPEEWREIVGEYHQAATQAIEGFGGCVAQYLGDGVMAYFGYPEAHDNDAECAARAGLEILNALSELNEQPERPRLAIRVGIDSGAVVYLPGTGPMPAK